MQTWPETGRLWRWVPHRPTGPSTLALLPDSAHRALSLPAPFLREELHIRGNHCPRRLRALEPYRSLREEPVHPARGTVPPRRRPPAGAQPLHSVPELRSRPRRLAPAPGLAMRFWRPEFRKVARPQVQRVCGLKFGGRWGQPSGGVRREGLGWTVRPTASDSRHLLLPSVFQSAGCGHASSRRRERRVGLRAPRGSCLRIRASQGPRSKPA